MERGRRDDGIDGVRITARPRRTLPRPGWLLVLMLVAVGVGIWITQRRADAVARDGSDGRTGPVDVAGAAPTAPARTDSMGRPDAPAPRWARQPRDSQVAATRVGADGEDPTTDLSDYVLPGEAPTMGQVIEALHARGIRTGLGAFPPPGTSPPVRGLAVPDDFPLPDGYVRHHQVTDDGQRIAPILMFSPDIDSILLRGVRVPIPADRIVTPDLAPPGLPLRRVVIPSPRDGGGRP